MSIALHNRVAQLEKRLESLEEALNILLQTRNPDLDESPVIVKLKNDIQGLKMRAGRERPANNA
jgi:uncharacterized protein involved in exopolysaccharide biosynthesis